MSVFSVESYGDYVSKAMSKQSGGVRVDHSRDGGVVCDRIA